MSLWVVRIAFLIVCTLGGFAVSQVRPEWLEAGRFWTLIGLIDLLPNFNNIKVEFLALKIIYLSLLINNTIYQLMRANTTPSIKIVLH